MELSRVTVKPTLLRKPIAFFLTLAFLTPQRNFWTKDGRRVSLDKAAPVLFQTVATDMEDPWLLSPKMSWRQAGSGLLHCLLDILATLGVFSMLSR